MPISKLNRRTASSHRGTSKTESKLPLRASRKAASRHSTGIESTIAAEDPANPGCPTKQEPSAEGRRIDSLQEGERLKLAEMLLILPLSEVQEQAVKAKSDGGFNVHLTTLEMKELFQEALKAAVQTAQKQLDEINQLTDQEDVYRRVGTPVLCLLQQMLQKLLSSSRPKHEEIKTYFNLLLASRKLDLLERKSLEGPENKRERNEEEKMEMVWDMFALPEEERVRRRALWKAHQNQAQLEQKAISMPNAEVEGQ